MKKKGGIYFMKKILSILLTLTVLVTSTMSVFAEETGDIKVLVNGTEVQFPYQKPIIQDGLLLAPAEDIFEALGFTSNYTEYEGQKGGIGGFGEVIPDELPTKHLSFEKTENTKSININFQDIEEYTGKPTTRFTRWFGGEKFELTTPLQFMGGRGVLTLTDICKATDASLDWNEENKIANITYDGTYFKAHHVITEEEKIRYGIYVPSLDTYLYIGMPKEEVEKLLGEGSILQKENNNYTYKDKNMDTLTITYNPSETQVIKLFIKSGGTEKFGHKIGDKAPIEKEYTLKENEYWLSFGMYSETYLAINDLENSKCCYQFLTDEKYYRDTNGDVQHKNPTLITAISMSASEDLINELGIDITTK